MCCGSTRSIADAAGVLCDVRPAAVVQETPHHSSGGLQAKQDPTPGQFEDVGPVEVVVGALIRETCPVSSKTRVRGKAVGEINRTAVQVHVRGWTRMEQRKAVDSGTIVQILLLSDETTTDGNNNSSTTGLEADNNSSTTEMAPR